MLIVESVIGSFILRVLLKCFFQEKLCFAYKKDNFFLLFTDTKHLADSIQQCVHELRGYN